jgi:DNA sulfur modification protein DndC
MARHSNTVLVVNISGGKDSIMMLGYLRNPTVRMIAVMADTGFEHINPISAEEFARQRCAEFGVEFHVVKNPNKTYLEMVERRGMFPSSATRQCTSDLKRGPIQTWIRRSVKSGYITEKYIINCMGLRAQESPARAKQPRFKKNVSLSKAGRHVYDWLPIHSASLADVLKWHWTNNVPLHPVYVPEYHADKQVGSEFKGFLRRLSCRVCIFSTKADLHAIYQRDHEAFDMVSGLEQRMNFTMRSGESLVQIIAAPLNNAKQYGSEEEIPCCA